ncbi:MAG TPA: DUF3320 domain-containing protein [Kofleriaceae bacterium]
MDRLVDWKQSLWDPTDRLLDQRDDGVPIAVDPVRLAFALAAGGALAVDAGVSGLDAGRLRVALGPDTLARELALLERAAREGAADGEHVLWLALGELTWTDAAGAARSSPLALWPVELVAARLAPAAGCAPRANDALLERLRADHGLALAGAHVLDLAALLDAAAEAAQERAGWRVQRTARLAAWSFACFDLWRDLDQLGDELASRAPVAWLAGGDPPPATPSQPDVLAPLDADASQLAAIAAAAGGASFVLQGAPGTGKSQTIANIVADCTSRGKTVLVVSDRRVALDTVLHRLATVGLAEFCLPLYGEHADRAHVVESLARTLERAFRPGSGPNAQTSRLVELAAALDRHAAALHAPGALGKSLHEVVGRLVELRTTPCAALAERDAALLDRAGFARRRAAVIVLADAACAVEPIAEHPWRAAAPDAWPDGATERAELALAAIAAATDALAAALAEVSALVPGFVARTPDQLRALGALADLASASPRPGAELLTAMRSSRADDIGERVALVRARGGGEIDPPRDPAELIALAHRHRALVAEVAEAFDDGIDELAVPELWAQLKRWAQRPAPMRYMALRAVRAEVRRVARVELADDAMIAALEAVIAERACRAAIVAVAEPARRWLGELAAHPLVIDLPRVDAAAAWAVELRRAFDRASVAGGDTGRNAAWRALVGMVSAQAGRVDESAASELAPFARLADAVARWEPALAELAGATGIAAARVGAGRDHLPALREQVAALGASVGSLASWARYHLARHAAERAGIGPALDAIERGDLAAADLAAAWERATLVAWGEAELRVVPVAGGAAHHARAAELADLDRRALQVAKARALARLAERVPRVLRTDADPQICALRAARTANGPVRDVLAALPDLLPRLAPCVLATPQAVARHLDPALVFDVVVFDEASRLPAAHALGALARARAAIVVGDARQPAPGGARDGLFELALDAGWPSRALAVHYRSRHDELFAFANRRYYGDAIEVAPAAVRDGLGASFVRVDGAPDAAGANRAEADALVAELARRAGDGRSFAIVAMSRAQAELIEAAIAEARAADPAFDAAVAGAAEPLLVGTPDRLQGEERDVALISIGGVPDSLGALAHPGGERWLAVAVTRARAAWVVFASFAPEDVAMVAPDLAELLASAARARGDEEAPASPITAAIARALGERGWIVRHRVGTGPYRVELAVLDPEDPARCVLAIEHDGAVYAAGRCARDRDRVRGEQLAARGWRVHRVWSLDWWFDPEREIQRAHGAIVAAIAAHRQKRTPAQRARVARGSAPLQAPALDRPSFAGARRGELIDTMPVMVAEATLALATGSGPQPGTTEITAPVVRIPRGAIAIGPYIAASIPPGRRTPDDLFAPRHAAELAKIVEQVLAAEAPMHIELLARRAAAYFGIGKVDDRVVEQVRAALAGRGRFGDEHGIVWRADQDPATVPGVRVPGSTASARRDIAEVPLSELAAAARVVVERAHDLDTADLVRGCARLLGFARLTDRVGERVALAIQLAAARQLITLDAGRARLP